MEAMKDSLEDLEPANAPWWQGWNPSPSRVLNISQNEFEYGALSVRELLRLLGAPHSLVARAVPEWGLRPSVSARPQLVSCR